VLFFDYRMAAKTFESIAENRRFDDEFRRSAARNAVLLYANMGERDKMKAARSTFYGLGASAEEKAEIDWLMSSADLKQWNERGLDRGANQTARRQATGSMEDYYRTNKTNAAASPFVVRAAYYAAKLRRKGGDPRHSDWCDRTVEAFERYKSGAEVVDGRNEALGTTEADMAAECEFRALDRQLAKDFDYAAGHHRYKGVIDDVTKEFKKDVEVEAKGWFDKLQHVITAYQSRRWAVAARARQGSLYDACRTGLYNAREPGLKLFNPKEQTLLDKLDRICEEGLSDQACDQADAFRANRRALWRQQRQQYLDDADRAMAAGYAEAIVWARAWKVQADPADEAIRRLAFYTDVIGDAKLRDYTSSLQDPATEQPFNYTDKMFLRMRRGMIKEPEKPEVLVAPLPVSLQ